MLRSTVGKVVWVGRATVFLVGLAVILVLVFGAATTAMGATGGNFLLGKKNAADAVSTLVRQGPGPALSLLVEADKPPLRVNAAAGTATNLSADELDGRDSSEFYAAGSKVADADALGGKAPANYQPRAKWARVLLDGTLAGGHGVVSVTRENPGIYMVKFDEDVAHTCSIIGSLNSGSGTGFVKAGSGGTGTPNDTVLVTTQNRDSTYVDNHFYVTVLC